VCTVSWIHEEDGYQLLCNRDEKRIRAQAFGPEILTREGVRFVAPTDRTAGGTWIGANEHGITACLLNGPLKSRDSVGRTYKSRGLLLPELLSAPSMAEARERVWNFDLSPIAPFSLAILEPDQHTTVIEWDGLDKVILPYGEPYMPLVSSSFEPEIVESRRREEFLRRRDAAGRLDATVLYTFHASHGKSPNAYSPCMHRSDAETVSFSWVKVTEAEIEFFYSPGAPCQWCPGETQKLARLQ